LCPTQGGHGQPAFLIDPNYQQASEEPFACEVEPILRRHNIIYCHAPMAG
jgi:hypothetical protein